MTLPKGIHRALGIRGHHDDAASGSDPIKRLSWAEMHSDSQQIMPEDLSQIIFTNFANIGSLASKTGDSANRVGC